MPERGFVKIEDVHFCRKCGRRLKLRESWGYGGPVVERKLECPRASFLSEFFGARGHDTHYLDSEWKSKYDPTTGERYKDV